MRALGGQLVRRVLRRFHSRHLQVTPGWSLTRLALPTPASFPGSTKVCRTSFAGVHGPPGPDGTKEAGVQSTQDSAWRPRTRPEALG